MAYTKIDMVGESIVWITHDDSQLQLMIKLVYGKKKKKMKSIAKRNLLAIL